MVERTIEQLPGFAYHNEQSLSWSWLLTVEAHGCPLTPNLHIEPSC